MYFIKEDSYTCPFCGCVVERGELNNPPEFKKVTEIETPQWM